MISAIISIPSLIKIRLSLLIAFSSLTGYVVAASSDFSDAWKLFLAVFLLAAGSAALNNFQDREIDKKMRRTWDRPIPKGKVHLNFVLILSSILIAIGLSWLFLIRNSFLIQFLGIAAVILYNFVYTPLKNKTTLAVFPGALCGMIPPLLGFLAAGGTIESARIWSLMIIMGIWQIPHFWLVLLCHMEDYNDSETKSMLKIFSVKQLGNILFVWVCVFAVMSLSVPLFRIVVKEYSFWFIFLNAVGLILGFSINLFISIKHNYRYLFIHLNLAVFFLMGNIIFEHVRLIGLI